LKIKKITEFDHEGRHILTGTTDGTVSIIKIEYIYIKKLKNNWLTHFIIIKVYIIWYFIKNNLYKNI